MRSPSKSLATALVVVAMVLAGPLHAVAFQKIELLTRLEALAAERGQQHHAQTMRRVFGVQQSMNSTSGNSSSPMTVNGSSSGSSGSNKQDVFLKDAPAHCQRQSAFGVALLYVDDVCTREFGKLDRVDLKNSTAARAGYNEFCASSCLSAMNQLLGDVEFRDCLPPDLAKSLEPVLRFCAKDARGEYCAVKFAELASSPPAPADSCATKSSQTACAGSTNCTWVQNDKKCEKKLTAADLDVVCDPCITLLAESSADLAPLALACRKVNGHYCALELQGFTLDKPEASALEHYCSANRSYAMACVSQMLGVVSQATVVKSQSTYVQCANRSGANVTQCVAQYLDSVQSVQQAMTQIPGMCRKNAAGQYCYVVAPAVFNDTCFAAVVTGTSCSTACASSIQSQSNSLGCCLGFMNELFTPKAFSLNQVPGPWATAANLPPPQALIRVQANISRVSACAGYAAAVPLSNACAGAAATATSVLSLNLKLNFSHINANADLKREVLRSLVEDVSATVGAPTAVIIDAALSENKGVLLNRKNDTGMTFTFKLLAETQALTDAYKAAFDAMNADGSFSLAVLASTLGFICPQACAGPQGAAHVVVAANVQALSLGSNVRQDPCYNREFFGLVSRVMAACDAEGNPFETTYTTAEASNATFGRVCGGPCVQGLRAAAKGKYHQCLPRELALTSNFVAVACSQDSKSHFFCGTVIHRFQSVDCDSRPNATSCNKGQCVWNANKSRCDTRPSKEFLSSICEGECVPLYTASMAGDQGAMGTEARFIDQAVCARENGTYCIPEIQQELNDEEFSLATVESLCGNGVKGRCFRRFQTAQSALVIKSAEEQFFSCAASAKYDEQKVVEQCLSAYFETLVMAEKYDDIVRNMCLRRTGTGVLCLSFFEKYANNSCLSSAAGGRCQSACNSSLAAVFDDMGCCAGTLQQIFGVPAHDYDLIPDFSGGDKQQSIKAPMMTTVTTPAPLPSSFVNASGEEEIPLTQGFLTAAYGCLGDPTMKFVRRACKKVREGSAVTKSLPLGIAYNAVKSDTKKKSRLERASRADLANKLGLAKDDIIEIAIGEDPTTKIAVSSSGRGFSEQQATTSSPTTQSSGSTLTFTVHAQSAADTNAASKTFDSAKASNSLTLPATTGTVSKECSNCVAAGASASSVQSAAPATTLAEQSTTTAPSSGSVHAALLSLVAAVVAAVLLL